jgi:hypothetical protein
MRSMHCDFVGRSHRWTIWARENYVDISNGGDLRVYSRNTRCADAVGHEAGILSNTVGQSCGDDYPAPATNTFHSTSQIVAIKT